MGTGAIDRRSTARLVRWLRVAGGTAPSTTQERQLDELASELALLREENARLKVKQQQSRPRPVHERVRELLPPGGEQDRDGDEPWQLLTECLMLRDGLVDACREIELGMRETCRRLDAILPGVVGDGAAFGDVADPRMQDDLESVA